jgi:hypothetical protein
MLRGTGKQLTRLQNSQLVMRIHSTIFRAVPEKQALKNRETGKAKLAPRLLLIHALRFLVGKEVR